MVPNADLGRRYFSASLLQSALNTVNEYTVKMSWSILPHHDQQEKASSFYTWDRSVRYDGEAPDSIPSFVQWDSTPGLLAGKSTFEVSDHCPLECVCGGGTLLLDWLHCAYKNEDLMGKGQTFDVFLKGFLLVCFKCKLFGNRHCTQMH